MCLLRVLAVFFLLFSGCRTISQLDEDVQLFRDDLDRESLHRAINQSLKFLDKIPPDRPVGEWPKRLTAREIKESLLSFVDLLGFLGRPERLLEEVRSRFELHESTDSSGKVLFTGYYRPVIEGRLARPTRDLRDADFDQE